MGCQAEVVIGKNLTFTITTHDPDTGELTDADALPVYRVYEDETAIAILTGTMTLLDAANTTGFYSELIACTTANGFEVDKSYNIYISAIVDGDTGGISYGFRAKAPLSASTAAIGASASAGEILIIRGDSMSQAITGLGDISTRAGAKMVWFTVKKQLNDTDSEAILMVTEGQGLVVLNGVDTTIAPIRTAEATLTVDDPVAGDITIWVNPTATDEFVPSGDLQYDVQWTDGTDVYTVALGLSRIAADATRAVA
jgi:hypothetical protein